MEDHLVAVEDELCRHDDGHLALYSGGDEMAETLARDELAPLVLAKASVNICDVHVSSLPGRPWSQATTGSVSADRKRRSGC